MWSNFHTHNQYCDGKGAIKDYAEQAVRSGVRNLGFSSHAPIPFPCKWCLKAESLKSYLDEIESVKPLFPDLEIYKGLEIDFIPGVISPVDFRSQLDYTIGSIHFVERFGETHWEIDNTQEVFREGLSRIFDNDIRKAITRYYELTREMVLKTPPDILGHLDKIKVNSRETHFEESEPWYREQIDKTVKAIASMDTIVEVNTRAVYKKKCDTPYPSPWILERMKESGIPVTISSDAHHPEDLTRGFTSALALLKDIGFRYLSVFDGGTWKKMPLAQYGTDC